MNPLTPNELERLDRLSPSSSVGEYDWVRATIRALSAENRKLNLRINALEDTHDLSVGKQDQNDV